jgi:hypothetical protein
MTLDSVREETGGDWERTSVEDPRACPCGAFKPPTPSVSQQGTGERDSLVDGILWRLLELPPASNATVRSHAVEFAAFLRWLHRTANERASAPSQQKGGDDA